MDKDFIPGPEVTGQAAAVLN